VFAALPADYRDSLISRMEEVALPSRTILYQSRQLPKYAHFLTSGIASIVTSQEDGEVVEVGMIGSEGVVEGVHLLGNANISTTGVVQISGTALRIDFANLQKEFLTFEPLRALILQSIQRQYLALGQIAGCNRLHEVEPRLARWLLMIQDRIRSGRFHLTQESLAEAIGARRSSVSLAAGNLQQSGLIEYNRGDIRILDREGLEDAACECYSVIRELM
jgi:CRP-like cAMP-binding protein